MRADPASWVPGWDSTGFPADALPYAICTTADGMPFVGVAIGDYALNLERAVNAVLLPDIPRAAVASRSLNALIGLEARVLSGLRQRLSGLLSTAAESEARGAVERCLIERAELDFLVPVAVGDFTDFYASEHHAVRSTRAVAPDASVSPNWYTVPVGYSSRAGAIVASGAQVVRPAGQQRRAGAVTFAPTQKLDFEAELGLVIGTDSRLGEGVPIEIAGDFIFGVSLLNDWSARDIQRWESTPLGPHLGKSLASQLGPWVVPIEALSGATLRNPAAGQALSHLRHDGEFLFDIDIEVTLASRAMAERGEAPVSLCRTNARHLHWDAAQMVTHITSNGAPLRVGDLLGTGTLSGPQLGESACLLELTDDGRAPLQLPDGTGRGYLEDGDRLSIRGTVARRDAPPISLGSLDATIVAARAT